VNIAMKTILTKTTISKAIIKTLYPRATMKI